MRKYLLSALATLLIFSAGAQWQSQNAGFTNDTLGFYEMSLPNKNTVWAVCYDGWFGLSRGKFVQDFTRTIDGGQTWIPGKMGNDHSLDFSNISAIDENEAWVAMNKRFLTGGGLFHTTDGGISWTQSSPDEIFDENSFPNFVHFKDKNKGIAMGDPNGGYFEVYTTTNKGKKWKRVPQVDLPAPLPNEFGWISGFAALDETLWFGTSAGRIYKTTDFGKNWTVHVVDPSGKFVNEIAFNDDMLHGVANLRNNFGQPFLYATSDGGLTWTNLGRPLNWKTSRITAVPGTNALISTSVSINPNIMGSAISYDNGLTWTELERTAPKAVCRFFDANTGYAGGLFQTGPPFVGGIYKSEIVFQLPPENHGNPHGENRSKPLVHQNEIISESQLKVFPTPANDVINILLPQSMERIDKVVTVLSIDGKEMQTIRSSALKSIQLNVSKLPAGTYVLRITARDQTISRLITIGR